MRAFAYLRAPNTEAATSMDARNPAFIAGGTCLVDYMRLGAMTPATVVDVTGLPFAGIDDTGHGVLIGALVKNSALAEHPIIVKRYPALAEALLSGATPQLRNLATVGGNLLQRTRCTHFRNLFGAATSASRAAAARRTTARIAGTRARRQ